MFGSALRCCGIFVVIAFLLFVVCLCVGVCPGFLDSMVVVFVTVRLILPMSRFSAPGYGSGRVAGLLLGYLDLFLSWFGML